MLGQNGLHNFLWSMVKYLTIQLPRNFQNKEKNVNSIVLRSSNFFFTLKQIYIKVSGRHNSKQGQIFTDKIAIILSH